MKLVSYKNIFGQNVQIFEAEVGDTVWFADGREYYLDGTVIQILTIPGWDYCHYLIEVDTGIDPIYEVRDGLTISDVKDRPLAWMRGVGLG